MTSSYSSSVTIPPVTRTKAVKGVLTVSEKQHFDALVDHFGIKKQDVLSRLILWWMEQPEDVQLLICYRDMKNKGH